MVVVNIHQPEFKNFLKQKGIRHEIIAPYSPQQNGVAERMNRTLQEGAWSLIFCAGLSKAYWGHTYRNLDCQFFRYGFPVVDWEVAMRRSRTLEKQSDRRWHFVTQWHHEGASWRKVFRRSFPELSFGISWVSIHHAVMEIDPKTWPKINRIAIAIWEDNQLLLVILITRQLQSPVTVSIWPRWRPDRQTDIWTWNRGQLDDQTN